MRLGGIVLLPKIIAVDFDGTLCEDKYPKIGLPKTLTIARVLIHQKRGTKIILWTCRVGNKLDDAVAFCKQFGLVFDAINENLPETVKCFGGNPRKIFAHEYWDDRAKLC